jgi:hypothetical protein
MMDNLNNTRKIENRSKQPNQDSLTWLTSSSNQNPQAELKVSAEAWRQKRHHHHPALGTT